MSAEDLRAGFATTRWSLVLAAGSDEPQSRAALASLCSTYWYPLYAFIRRQGHDADQARDLTQGFFTRLLEKEYLRIANPERGRFRSFLLTACRHFLANERDWAQAKKRGGGQTLLSIDAQDAEQRYAREPAHDMTPERLYHRRWVLILLDQVLRRLRAELAEKGREQQFEALKGFLTGERAEAGYAEVAKGLGMTVGALKVTVHRLRRRYGELLREEIGRTVNTDNEIDDEIRGLFEALG